MHIRVEHRIGHLGMQMPCSLQFGGRHIEVVETLDQWHGPDYRYVKIKCDDGCIYILRYDKVREDWELTMFQRGTH